MFAVPGWSVSATSLKAETLGTLSGPSSETQQQTKPRKKSAPKVNVTTDNIAELWEKVIEHKRKRHRPGKKDAKRPETVIEDISKKASTGKSSTQESKKRKHETSSAASSAVASNRLAEDGGQHPHGDGLNDEQPKPKKSKKWENPPRDRCVDDGNDPRGKSQKSKREKIPKLPDPDHKSEHHGKLPNTAKGIVGDVGLENTRLKAYSKEQASLPMTARPPIAANLTPLQASMREKLISARFRHLNETLYTRPSTEAFQLFRDSPEMFTEYHEGFRRQVSIWPENPVDSYIAEITARGSVKPAFSRNAGRHQHRDRRRRPQAEPAAAPGALLSLPRTSGTCIIADLGCGDAALATALQPLLQKLRLDIRSFDLQSPSPLVTRADMANLPLADGAVDVAIFCLALMGTNWVDFVEEAYRVLHWKGELWVAEIKSRFAAVGRVKKAGSGRGVVEHSVGHRKKGAAAAGGKKANAAADAVNGATQEAELAVEVDGAEDRRQQTDVSAFVEVLSKRGFVLRGEPSEAVNLNNKMFVNLYFVKAASPVKGKGVVQTPSGLTRPGKKKFINTEDDEDGLVDESAILKPCVYKLR